MKKAPINFLTLLAASGLLFGCATAEQKDYSAEIAQVRALAEKAAADAAAAQSRADAAMAAAASAKAQSADTEAKIDRMFKKAMYK